MGMLSEFKEFAIKGNMVDMAVGIIIGAAFGTVINSLVGDMLMPVVSSIFKVPDFRNMFTVLGSSESFTTAEAATEVGHSVLSYGLFINSCIAFLLVAFALFMVVKGINRMKREEEAVSEAPPEPTKEEVLLTEIRDALRQ